MPASNVYLIRKNRQWAKYTQVTAVTLTGASDELEVWSSEYRDIHTKESAIVLTGNAISQNYTGSGGTVTANVKPGMDITLAQGLTLASPTLSAGVNYTGGAINQGVTETVGIEGTLSPSISDEVAHQALRQTKLKRTHWKFDFGASATPRYLYATWADGDILANNPPETDA